MLLRLNKQITGSKMVLLYGLSKTGALWFILVLSISLFYHKQLQLPTHMSVRLDRPRTKWHVHAAVTKITKDPVQKRRDQDILETNTLLDRFIVVPEYKLLFCYSEKNRVCHVQSPLPNAKTPPSESSWKEKRDSTSGTATMVSKYSGASRPKQI